jgi:hypothetical protein
MTETHTAHTTVSFADRTLPATPPGLPTATILADIAADAARRANTLLTNHELVDDDPIVDLVRLLQETGATPAAVATAADRAGLSTAALNRLRVAYTFGGLDGLRTAHCAHDPDPTVVRRAIEAIRRHRATTDGAPAVTQNSLTFDASAVQIRLSPAGQWFPYTETAHGWAPAQGQSPDPTSAYQAALTARRNRQA